MKNQSETYCGQKYLKVILLSCCFILVNWASAQDTIVPSVIKSPNIKYRYTRDSKTLATELTRGLTDEKEKSDAIFAWVVNNIRYDSKVYNSGRANSSNKPIKKVLRRKQGICTDYANLMDTLCDHVGIKNTTVGGYTKEVIFDVNDSLYFDNHAWNAVKLDGFWYLYDVTWSSGGASYDYTRMGKWRVKMINKLLLKAKLETRTLALDKNRRNKFCKIDVSRKLMSVEVMVLPLIPRILVKVLNYFPFRMVEVYTYVVNTDYYLTDPEVFSLDHFPNDAKWSFSYDISSVSEFTKDSTVYYPTDSLYDNQEREGRSCIKCDDFLAKEPIKKEKEIIATSRENNLNNHLVPANGFLSIAQIYLQEMSEEMDSLPKMQLFDSTLFYLNACKIELRESRVSNRVNNKFHLDKNKAKRKQLLKENKRHWALTNKTLKATAKRKLNIRSLRKKSKVYEKRGKSDYNKFNRAFLRSSSRELKPEKVQMLLVDLTKSNASSDSLSLLITTAQDEMVNDLTLLWGNLLKELNVLNPLISNFSMDGYARGKYFLDSYDRQIREIRAVIDQQEALFLAEMDTNVLFLSDSIYLDFRNLYKMIRKRNSFDLKSAKIMWKLINGGGMARENLNQLKQVRKNRMQEDACWYTNNQVIIREVTSNFEDFVRRNKRFYQIVRRNDNNERYRYKMIDIYVKRNTKRANNALVGNKQIMNNVKKNLYTERNVFLKKLKRERGE